MRRPAAVVALSVLLVVPACSSGDSAPADPASIDSCTGIAEAGIDLVQDTLDVIDSLSAEELAALGSSETPPPALAAIEATGEELQARADVLGCTPEQLAGMMSEMAGDLNSDTVFGQFLIESIRQGDAGFFE